MSGEVWRSRVDDRWHRKSARGGADMALKWEQVDGVALEGILGGVVQDELPDGGGDARSTDDESDLTSNGGNGEGGTRGGSNATSDSEDNMVDDNGANLAAFFTGSTGDQNSAAGGWGALAAAAIAAGNPHDNESHAAFQAGIWAGVPPAPGGGMPGFAPGFDANGNPTRPSPRCAASWTSIQDTNTIYLFGGLGSDNNFLGDLWCFHAGSRSQARWELLRTVRREGDTLPEVEGGDVSIPASRWGHTMVEHQGALYMFGGSSPGRAYTGLWRLDTSVRPCVWTLLPCEGKKPPPRGGHSATVVRDTLYIFGGNITKVRSLGGESGRFTVSWLPWLYMCTQKSKIDACRKALCLIRCLMFPR